MSTRARPLVHPRVDGWLLGGAGVVAWVLVSPHSGWATPAITGWVTWTFLAVSAMHFGASYHLAYAGGRRALREHPWALVVAPAALLAAAATAVTVAATASRESTESLLKVLLVGVFTLTGWHYIKQAYGVGMLSIRSRSVAVSRREALVLRYSLYPVWLFQVLATYGHESTASYRGINTSVHLVPELLEDALKVAALASAAIAAVVIVRFALRMRAVPPAGLWATYLAAVLWFVFTPGYVSTGLILGGVHALQYLACAHRAEVDRAVEQGERQLVHWWLCVFGGAAAGGLILLSFLPARLDATGLVGSMPGLYAVVLFIVLNLHHYAIDATIWRAGGEHVRRISKGPAVTPAPTPAPATDGASAQPAFA